MDRGEREVNRMLLFFKLNVCRDEENDKLSGAAFSFLLFARCFKTRIETGGRKRARRCLNRRDTPIAHPYMTCLLCLLSSVKATKVFIGNVPCFVAPNSSAVFALHFFAFCSRGSRGPSVCLSVCRLDICTCCSAWLPSTSACV